MNKSWTIQERFLSHCKADFVRCHVKVLWRSPVSGPAFKTLHVTAVSLSPASSGATLQENACPAQTDEKRSTLAIKCSGDAQQMQLWHSSIRGKGLEPLLLYAIISYWIFYDYDVWTTSTNSLISTLLPIICTTQESLAVGPVLLISGSWMSVGYYHPAHTRSTHTTVCMAQSRPDSGMTRKLLLGIWRHLVPSFHQGRRVSGPGSGATALQLCT